MRVLRVLAGMVALAVAVPALLAGALSWYAMQHRDDSGRFRAGFEPVADPGYAVVVPDVDAVLHRDAPFIRAGRTSVRLTAVAGMQPLFLGLASPGDVAALLRDAPFTRLDGISVGRGPLGVRTAHLDGPAVPVSQPADQPMWLASGVGSLSFEPSDWRGKPVTLVVMTRDAQKIDSVALGAAVHFGWLDSTTWGLLILGPVVLLLGFVVLAWPSRQVVYVMATPRATAPVVTWMDVATVELPVITPAPGPTPTPPPAGPAPDSGRITDNAQILTRDPSTNPDPAASTAATKKAGDEAWARPEPESRPEPELEWPPPESPQQTRDPVDIPTQEMPILPDLPRVPLQLNGVGRVGSASGPAGGGGPTLTGGTV